MNIDRQKRDDIAIIAVLNAGLFNSDDISSLRSQSGVDIPIYLSPKDLTDNWLYLSNKYSKQLLDGVLFLYQDNELIKTAEASCACDDDIFSFMQTLGERDE